MKNKNLKLINCADCGTEFISKYARKNHSCGKVGVAYTDRVEALKRQREAADRRRRMTVAWG